MSNDKQYWDSYWVDNSQKNTFFNTMVSIARKAYFAKAFARFINKHYPVKGKTIYEIGSGTGLTLAHLKTLGAKQCVGVDYSDEAVKIAKAENKHCDFILDDAFNLENIKDNSCDLVYSLGFLEHYTREEQKQLLNEQSRIAKDCVFIEVPYKSPHMNLLCEINKKMGRTTTFSDEELFTKKTFQELALKGTTKLMPSTFYLTIGHFEDVSN